MTHVLTVLLSIILREFNIANNLNCRNKLIIGVKFVLNLLSLIEQVLNN